jgi:hypothetical protein
MLAIPPSELTDEKIRETLKNLRERLDPNSIYDSVRYSSAGITATEALQRLQNQSYIKLKVPKNSFIEEFCKTLEEYHLQQRRVEEEFFYGSAWNSDDSFNTLSNESNDENSSN